MMVRFTSKAGPDIVMFKGDAMHLLRMMQHSGTIPSAILADDVGSSLAHLERASRGDAGQATDVSSGSEAGEDEANSVSIQTRAFPLVELFKAAKKRKGSLKNNFGFSKPIHHIRPRCESFKYSNIPAFSRLIGCDV